MLATINSSASSEREVCGSGSRFSHALSRPTSFLIRDILGKRTDPGSSDSDEHESSKALFREKNRISSEEDQERCYSAYNNSLSLPPTLCCRECITKSDARRKHSLNHTSSASSKVEDEDLHENSDQHSLHRAPKTLKLNETRSEQEEKLRLHFEDSNSFRKFSASKEVMRSPRSPDVLTHQTDLISSDEIPKSKDVKTKDSPCNLELSSASEDECVKGQSERLSASHKSYHDEEKLERNFFDRLKGTAAFNQNSLYGGLYPSAQNLIDLNYAFNLRAASAFGIPQLALPYLTAYRNRLHRGAEDYSLRAPQSPPKVEPVLSESKSPRFDPYPRYRLLDWPQGRTFSSRNSAFMTLNQRENFPSINQDPNPESAKHERRGFSLQSASPTYSDHSHSSPVPEKRPVQLPAYFRSRLGGSCTSEETCTGGKTKKCRRSRTVFTELQVRKFK